MINYYKVLGVSMNAQDVEIRKSFRQLAKKYHPDKNNSSKVFEEKFKIILEAYDTLSDYDRRQFYDMKLAESLLTRSTVDNRGYGRAEFNEKNTKREVKEESLFPLYSVFIIITTALVIAHILNVYNVRQKEVFVNQEIIESSSPIEIKKPLNKTKTFERPETGEIKFSK